MLRMIYNVVQTDKKNAEADRINIRAFGKLAQAEEKVNRQQQETQWSLEKLANRKKGILVTSMKDFLQTYEKIMKIDFKESDGLKELNWSSLSSTLYEEMKTMTSVAGIPMTEGQTIATFILGGGISGIIRKEAEINVSVANMRIKQANVVESQAETICVALQGIKERADRISELLVKLNLLLRKTIETTDKMIMEKGRNRNNYTRYDKECMMNCINTATTVKGVIDTGLLDEHSQITNQSLEAIQIGQGYLQKMNEIVS